MSIEVFHRYEKKYRINEAQYGILLEVLSKHMRLDDYNLKMDFYPIANLYYDTPADDLIRRSLEKPMYKEKLRLRSYGVPGMKDKVFLEIKKKYDGLVNKRRITLPLDKAYHFLETGDSREIEQICNPQVTKEIEYFLGIYNSLRAKTYIAYDRKAFFGIKEPDLRVTFDTNIRTRRENLRLEYGDEGKLLLPEKEWLLEIKSAYAMPLWLSKVLNENEIYSSSFSKYGTEFKNTIMECS